MAYAISPYLPVVGCLRKGARAALQFYPETAAQVEMITAAALRCGFGGGLVVDYPHSAKAKKHFLVIYAGLSGEQPANMPEPMEDEEEQVAVNNREREVKKRKSGKGKASYKDKVLKKKEHQRKKGVGVARVQRPDGSATVDPPVRSSRWWRVTPVITDLLSMKH
eukprot:Skav209680  [mRNA]  locus=scaffold1603:140872:145327:- [translate_table: standard]